MIIDLSLPQDAFTADELAELAAARDHGSWCHTCDSSPWDCLCEPDEREKNLARDEYLQAIGG